MNLAPVYFHFTRAILKDALVFGLKPIDSLVNHLWNLMRYLAIINMETNRNLLALDNLVSHTPIIRVELESMALEALDELLVVLMLPPLFHRPHSGIQQSKPSGQSW